MLGFVGVALSSIMFTAIFTAWAPGGLAQGSGGDPARGRELAQRLCSNCHVVAPGTSASVTAGIPTFAEMARGPDQTAEHLAIKMMAPHPPMPNISLTTAEIRDLAAYILSLKGTN